MLKCKECGSEDFYLGEKYSWKAFVDDEGVLQCQKATSKIETIICEKCGKKYNENAFKEVNFN